MNHYLQKMLMVDQKYEGEYAKKYFKNVLFLKLILTARHRF